MDGHMPAASRSVQTPDNAWWAAALQSDMDTDMALLLRLASRGEQHPEPDPEPCLVFDDSGDFSQRGFLVPDAHRHSTIFCGVSPEGSCQDRGGNGLGGGRPKKNGA